MSSSANFFISTAGEGISQWSLIIPTLCASWYYAMRANFLMFCHPELHFLSLGTTSVTVIGHQLSALCITWPAQLTLSWCQQEYWLPSLALWSTWLSSCLLTLCRTSFVSSLITHALTCSPPFLFNSKFLPHTLVLIECNNCTLFLWITAGYHFRYNV